MTEQILNQANELKEKIRELKTHRCEKAFTEELYRLKLDPKGNTAISNLYGNFLPINLDTFIKLYLMNVEAKIADLEEQFKNLKTD